MTEARAAGKTTPPTDQAQREAALDLARSCIVQAPAGSGKTELLTQRLLKLLARVDRPERVLAITFTRKATQEMRERIMRRLAQARDGTPPEPHEVTAVCLAAGVLANDARHGWNLLDHPGRLRILTIDALCAQLLQRSAEHGGAVAGLRLLEQARPLYRRAVRRLFEDLDEPDGLDAGAELHASLVRVLVHLDGDAQRLEDLLVDLLAIRDQWIDHMSRPISWQTGGQMDRPGATMQDVLHHRQAAEFDAFCDALGAAAADRAMALLERLGGAVSEPEHFAARLAGLAGREGREAALWRAHWLAQMLVAPSSRKPRGKTGIKPGLFPGAEESLRPLIDELSEIYQRWHGQPAALEAIERIARHPPLDERALDDRLLDDVLALLPVLLAELSVEMDEQGATDFQHLAQAALQCLEPAADGAVSPVLLAEDLRLEHLLVDEFQDTSHTQHRLIRRLTEGWQPDDGRTLFLVGDPMQSIYRFRQADVGLFTRVVRERQMGSVAVEPLALTANFRSRAELVDWANAQFREIFPVEDRRDSGAVAYHPAVAEREPGGSVELHPLAPEETSEGEARQIAGLIRGYTAAGADPQIAVLVRARSHLLALARELSRSRIAFDAVEIDPLAERPVIQDLLALARVLCQPADRVAWLALLRAPWCALTVPLLHRIAGEDPHADLLQRVAGAGADEAVPAADRERLQRLGEVMQSAFDQAGVDGLAGRVETAWLRLGGPRCYAGPEELENAASFLALLDSLERESPVELIERLHEALADLYARGRPSPVQLMTIHKAKGLEFDVVIVPGMHRTGRRDDSRLVMAQQFTLAGAPGQAGPGDTDGVLMAAVTSRRHSGPSLYDYLKAVDAERQRYELQRLLYVAATRAKTHLHLFGRFRCTSRGAVTIPAGSFMDLLRPAFMTAIEASGYQPGAAAPEPGEPVAMPLLRLSELPPLPAPIPPAAKALSLPAPPDRNAAALGDALHRLFEAIHDAIHDYGDPERGAEWAESLAGNEALLDSLLRRGGAETAALPELRSALQAMLRRAVTTEPGRALLSRRHTRQSCSELPVLARDGDRISRHVIDLVYQDAAGAWHIVDYKTGVDSEATREEWRQQLGCYAGLLGAITGGAPASQGVYLARQGEAIEIEADGLEAT